MKMTRIALLLSISCFLIGCSTLETTSSTAEQFTIVVIPDTQNLIDYTHQKNEGFALDSADIFIEQMANIANKGKRNGGNVVFVASVGDVWQHVISNQDPAHSARGVKKSDGPPSRIARFINEDETLNFEIPKSIQGYQLISDAGIPFGVAPGNHDYDAWWLVSLASLPSVDEDAGDATDPNLHVGGLKVFRSAFGSDTDFFRDKPWYESGFQGGGSSAQVFSAGAYKFLHFAFEMQAGDQVLAWAQKVIDRNPGLPTFISTHDYLDRHGQRNPASGMNLAYVDPQANNSAERIWQQFIRKNDQIFMVLSGHQVGQAMRIDQNDAGHNVYQLLADYQQRGQAGIDSGQPLTTNRGKQGPVGLGDGWYREMVFNVGGPHVSIEVNTYSSHYKRYSVQLNTYAEWYKDIEQPEMTDIEFERADDFVINLDDFYERFGKP
jgi:hypothetical protein